MDRLIAAVKNYLEVTSRDPQMQSQQYHRDELVAAVTEAEAVHTEAKAVVEEAARITGTGNAGPVN